MSYLLEMSKSTNTILEAGQTHVYINVRQPLQRKGLFIWVLIYGFQTIQETKTFVKKYKTYLLAKYIWYIQKK